MEIFLASEVPHVSKLSISDQARHGAMQRHDFLIPEALLPENIGRVRLPGTAAVIPAVVACRSVLMTQELLPTSHKIRDQWRLSVMPYEENLLRRALARAGVVGPLDIAPAPLLGEHWPARSDITRAMNDAHRALSELRPPFEGTMILVVLWQDRIGDVRVDFVASSITGIQKERQRALQNNRLVAATSWPFGSPIRVPSWVPLVGRKPVWGRGEVRFVPEVPEMDEWVLANRDRITSIVTQHFKPALLSLWKAAFAEPPVSEDLSKQGYALTESDRTMLGSDGLKELMSQRGSDPACMTVLGTPEMLEELAAEFIEAIRS